MLASTQRLRRRTLGLLGSVLGISLLVSAAPASRADHGADARRGTVYTETNATTGNAVVIFRRGSDGSLSVGETVATGGAGAGTGLGSQGAVILSDDGRWLFAVDAGSNDIAAFAVHDDGLQLAGVTPSGGVTPISLTLHDNVLYVLNGGGTNNNITGFRLSRDGTLTPIPDSTRALSAPMVGPAEVAFSPDGDVLVVSEKSTNIIDTFDVRWDGRAGEAMPVPSSGDTPFGFAFSARGTLVVSEAAGSVSSYRVETDGDLGLITASAPTYGNAPCWIAITPNAEYAYAANAHGGTISGFNLSRHGALNLLDPSGLTANTGMGSAPLDMAVGGNGRFLHVLVSGLGGIDTFRIEWDGSLTRIGGVVGALPGSVTGLATR